MKLFSKLLNNRRKKPKYDPNVHVCCICEQPYDKICNCVLDEHSKFTQKALHSERVTV
jgi:hypothetical protein